jgi:hypothetical protein
MIIWLNGAPANPERAILNIVGDNIGDDIVLECTTMTGNRSSSYDALVPGPLSIGPAVATSLLFGNTPTAFFGSAAVAKQTSAGDVHTVAAGATTGVFVNTTFDGTTGSTAYTIGDIVKALKAYGLLTA